MPSTSEMLRDGLLTVDQACARLAISKSLLRKELEKNDMLVVRLGRRLFIPPQTCDDLVRLGLRPFHPYVRGRGQ
jgi:excisionase family DNA binding protein